MFYFTLKRDSTDYVYTSRTFHKEIKKVLNLHGRIIQPPKKIVVARFITFHHHTTAAEDALKMQQAK